MVDHNANGGANGSNSGSSPVVANATPASAVSVDTAEENIDVITTTGRAKYYVSSVHGTTQQDTAVLVVAK